MTILEFIHKVADSIAEVFSTILALLGKPMSSQSFAISRIVVIEVATGLKPQN
ncbi:MAG: hypothetical protein KGJ87_02560 [Planctomycetota bacterium]|nr:hypothetical protein [Planctomycetota bacterium]MDE2216033.1 hypothetical protein [Planctomycetota bacterium]